MTTATTIIPEGRIGELDRQFRRSFGSASLQNHCGVGCGVASAETCSTTFQLAAFFTISEMSPIGHEADDLSPGVSNVRFWGEMQTSITSDLRSAAIGAKRSLRLAVRPNLLMLAGPSSNFPMIGWTES